jgi:hypothetical protein
MSIDIAPKAAFEWNEAIGKKIIWMVENNNLPLPTLNPPDLGSVGW